MYEHLRDSDRIVSVGGAEIFISSVFVVFAAESVGSGSGLSAGAGRENADGCRVLACRTIETVLFVALTAADPTLSVASNATLPRLCKQTPPTSWV